MKRNILITLSITLIVIIQIPMVYSAYRESIPITVKGNLYVLDLSINVTFINDYGVITIYLKPTGGYSYGFIIMKDPDEEKPHIYLMTGAQSNWHDLGLLNETTIKFRLFIDYNLSRTVYLFNNNKKIYDLDFIPHIEYLYLSSFNLISRSIDYPKIIINYLKLYVLNNTLDNIDVTIENIEEYLNIKPVIYTYSTLIISSETQIETTREQSDYQLSTDNTLALIFAMIATIIVIIIIVVIYYKMSK